MSANDVGTIERAALAAMLPKRLTIRRASTGKLYVVTPWSPLHMQTSDAQAMLKKHGHFDEGNPPGIPVQARSAPATAPETPPEAPPAEPEPPAGDNQEPAPKKRSIFDFFGDLD